MRFSTDIVVSAVNILTQRYTMPAVNKQTPNGQIARSLPNQRQPTSLLSQAISVADLNDDKIKLTVYGQNRVGKTTLACTFPKPLLLLSFEPNRTGGAQSIRKVPGVDLVRIKYKPEINPITKQEMHEGGVLYGSASALQLADELIGDTKYKTVVIDSATSFQDLFLQEILGITKLPEQLNFKSVSGDQYRERSERIKEGLRPFLNLNKHVVITAKEKDHNPPKEEKINPNTGKLSPDMRAKFLRGMQPESFFAADLGGAAVSWLHDACDYIGRLYLDKEVIVHEGQTRMLNGKPQKTPDTYEETGRIVHRLRTMYHPNYAAGFRASTPSAVPECIDEPTYEKIRTVVDGMEKK